MKDKIETVALLPPLNCEMKGAFEELDSER